MITDPAMKELNIWTNLPHDFTYSYKKKEKLVMYEIGISNG